LNKADTLPKLLKKNFETYGDRQIALSVKDYGIWRPYSWKDYYEKTKYFFMGLLRLGLEQGDTLCVLGETKPEAYFAELAVQAMRGKLVGIFTDCLPEEVKYFVRHSDAKIVVAHDQEQVDKLLHIEDEIPLVKKIVYWEEKGLWNYESELLIRFEEVMDLGRRYEKSDPGCFERMIDEGSGEDLALICYTSGTTGDPKGVMISHKTIIGTGGAWARMGNWTNHDHYVSFLPLAWITEQMMIAGGLVSGTVINFTESIETVQEDIRETGPTILFWGSRNWESVNRLIQAKMTDATFINRFLFNTFLKIGYRVADMDLEGKTPSALWRLLNTLGQLLVFRDLRDRVGLLKARNAYTGGAPISPDVVRFFKAIGVNIRVAYGMSEFPLISVHRDEVNPGTVGPPLPHATVKIADSGEILVKGEFLFSGYYKNEAATAEKVKDGWYKTGDFGHITEKGHLVVMDRLDDLRTLSDGTKFAPQYIESRLRFSPYIKDALVTGGEDRNFVGAVVNIDLDNVGRWAEKKKIAYTTFTDLSQKPEVVALIRKEFERVNSLLPDDSRVRKFVNLHKEFDPDEAELTRTRKIKREFMESRYADLIDAIYGDADEITIEAPVTYRDGRKGVIKTPIKVNKLS